MYLHSLYKTDNFRQLPSQCRGGYGGARQTATVCAYSTAAAEAAAASTASLQVYKHTHR